MTTFRSERAHNPFFPGPGWPQGDEIKIGVADDIRQVSEEFLMISWRNPPKWYDGHTAEVLRHAGKGEITPENAAEWATRLTKIPIEVPENPALQKKLNQVRASGQLTLADAQSIIALTGQLSSTEQHAIGVALLPLALTDRLDPKAFEALTDFRDGEVKARDRYERRLSIEHSVTSYGAILLSPVVALGAAILAAFTVGFDSSAVQSVSLAAAFGAAAVGGGATIARLNTLDQRSGRYGTED